MGWLSGRLQAARDPPMAMNVVAQFRGWWQGAAGSVGFWLWLGAIFLPLNLPAEPDAGPGYQRPEVRLFSAYFGRPQNFTPEEIQRLAGFDLILGQPLGGEVLAQVRQLNPRFQFIHFATVATVRSTVAEKQLRRWLLYHPCARLVAPLNARSASFKLKPYAAGRIPLRASTVPGELSWNSRQYVAWIRVDDELMRIESFNTPSGEISVTRNFDGQSTQAHAADTLVFAPVYALPPGGQREWEQPQPLHYFFDPAFPNRWSRLHEELAEAAREGASGVWLDLFAERNWREVDLEGTELKPANPQCSAAWNFAASRPYAWDELWAKNEAGIRATREKFQTQSGCALAVYAAGLAPGSQARHTRLLRPAGGAPPLLAGLGCEDFMGTYSLEEWLVWQKSRQVSAPKKAVYPSKAASRNWAANMRLVMDCAQAGLPVLPFILNASPRAAIFETLDPATRHQWELWAYASYLVAAPTTNGPATTLLGLPLFAAGKEGREVCLDPMYFWRLGPPLETRPAADLEKYRLLGANVFQRRFTHGLVLVNPTTERATVKLDRAYQDPENNAPVKELELEAQSGKILLESAAK